MSPFHQIAATLSPNSTLQRTWQLTGGVSAEVTALEIQRAGGTTFKAVVRRHGARDLAANPHIAAHEFALLTFLHEAGIPVPHPFYFDESGKILPTPYVVIGFVEGTSDIAHSETARTIPQMAAHLAAIHRLVGVTENLSFLPRQHGRVATLLQTVPPTLDGALSEGQIRARLNGALPLLQSNSPVLLHGDYWQGNLFWKDGQLTAILDWEDAALGHPMADVGNARLELLWALGEEAMLQFTAAYRALMPFDEKVLPYWDLVAALRPAGKLSTWGLPSEVEATMRKKHHWFVQQAEQLIVEQQQQVGKPRL